MKAAMDILNAKPKDLEEILLFKITEFNRKNSVERHS
jgi:hypothetical protein